MKNDLSLLDFTSLDEKQLKMILSWRNDPLVKKWMFTQEDIQLNDHLNFVNSLKNNQSKKYFLVKKGNQYIGIIDFCDISKSSVTMGVYKNPTIFGVGDILMNTIIEYSFVQLGVKKIYSEVFEENIKAVQLYKSFGFNPFHSKIINKKKVICMELIDENR